MKPGCWKNIAGGVVVLAVVVTAVGASAAPAEQDFTSPATLRKGVGIVVNTTLKIGNMLAPGSGFSTGSFFISPTSTIECIKIGGGGACLADATRNRGSLSFTGEPNFTVFVTSNIPLGGTPVDCTGGTGMTPVKLVQILFSAESALLDVTGNSNPATPIFVGAVYTLFNTSLGTQTCPYQIIADY